MYNISSSGPASTQHPNWIGLYLRTELVSKNNRPVWRLGAGNRLLFYNDQSYWVTQWVVGGNYLAHGPVFRSRGRFLDAPPETGWWFNSGGNLGEDPQLQADEQKGKQP